MNKTEIALDIKVALEVQQAAIDDDRQLKRNVLTILKYENNAVQVAQRLGVPRQYLYRWIKGKFLPKDPVIRELINQWARAIKDLQARPSSQ